jgi:hypothetical protein
MKDKAVQLGKDWLAIVRDAKANGIPLPSVELAAKDLEQSQTKSDSVR